MEKVRRAGTAKRMRLRWAIGSLAAMLVGALALLYNFSPAQYSFYPRCPFYSATHWLCPGCGSTRALYALLHGDWHGALHYNSLFTLLTPAVLTWSIYCSYRAMRYDRFPRVSVPRSVIVGMGTVVLLFTIARNTLFTF